MTAISSEGLDFVKKISEEYPNLPEDYFRDQLALIVLSQLYDYREIGVEKNYALPHREQVGEQVKVVHYHNYTELRKLFFSSRIDGLGIRREIPKSYSQRLFSRVIYPVKSLGKTVLDKTASRRVEPNV